MNLSSTVIKILTGTMICPMFQDNHELCRLEYQFSTRSQDLFEHLYICEELKKLLFISMSTIVINCIRS